MHSLFLFDKVFISLSFFLFFFFFGEIYLLGIEYWIGSFFFLFLKMSLHCLPAYIVSDEKL